MPQKMKMNNGHMLQIFIKRSDVDGVAYDSLPYGKYSGRGPISTLLTETQSSLGPGQARIFVHPELMLNHDRSHIFHYCADSEFAKNRSAFRAELKSIILKQYKDYESIRKASCIVRAVPYTEEK